MSLDVAWRLLAVALLVAANAFFVAAEFALVAVRRTRVEELVRAGSRKAADVKRALGRLDDFIAAAQLGITIASLALGWIGEPAVARLIEPALAWLPLEAVGVASHTVAVALGFSLITFLHVVLGEQAPKSAALAHAEGTALWVARPAEWFLWLFRPAIRALSGSTALVLRLFGLRRTASHIAAVSEEELKMLIAAAAEKGLLERRERELLTSVFEFTDTTCSVASSGTSRSSCASCSTRSPSSRRRRRWASSSPRCSAGACRWRSSSTSSAPPRGSSRSRT
jgi:putative hemolysin